MRAAFVAACNAHDPEALTALYEPGAVLCTGPGVSVRGIEAIRESFRRFAAMRPRLQMTTQTVFASGDIALPRGPPPAAAMLP
jgi:uncharacterized protein (TIGR02246 family)